MISLKEWGKDHWSLLAYLETRCVDNEGFIDNRHLRCNEDKHPFQKGAGNPKWESNYSTILKEGMREGHDDWDCLFDMEHAGLVTVYSLVNRRVEMTAAGIEISKMIREHKMKGGTFKTFNLENAKRSLH